MTAEAIADVVDGGSSGMALPKPWIRLLEAMPDPVVGICESKIASNASLAASLTRR
jgi:hypothetical protein